MIHPLRSLAIALVLTAAGLARPTVAPAQESIPICSDQQVPNGYVVVAIDSRADCPGYYSRAYNSITVRQPGDTVTVCSTLSTLGGEYARISASSSATCPGYYSSTSNTATYRRLAAVLPPGHGPAATSNALAVLDQYDRTVFLRMREMEEWLGLAHPTHQMWRASAQPGATAQTSLQVQAGMRYTLAGVCDDDCTDLDLRVLDGSYVVAQDVQTDAHARLELTPAQDGTLVVEVIMAACSVAPCRYGVGVYETPPLAAIQATRPPRRRPRITPPDAVRPSPQQRP